MPRALELPVQISCGIFTGKFPESSEIGAARRQHVRHLREKEKAAGTAADIDGRTAMAGGAAESKIFKLLD